MSSRPARHPAACLCRRHRLTTFIVSSCALGLLSSAPALGDVLSFTYSDLRGDYSAGTSTFTAVSRLTTDGDVTRLLGPATTSSLDFGSSGIGQALFNLTMDVINPTSTTPLGSGTLVLRDTNGDRFDAEVSGVWYKMGSSANFVGEITSITRTVASGTPSFDGTAGSFDMNLPDGLTGNIVTLAYGGWFSSGGLATNFNNKTTLISGAVTPEPASLVLLLAGSLALARRRIR